MLGCRSGPPGRHTPSTRSSNAAIASGRSSGTITGTPPARSIASGYSVASATSSFGGSPWGRATTSSGRRSSDVVTAIRGRARIWTYISAAGGRTPYPSGQTSVQAIRPGSGSVTAAPDVSAAAAPDLGTGARGPSAVVFRLSLADQASRREPHADG